MKFYLAAGDKKKQVKKKNERLSAAVDCGSVMCHSLKPEIKDCVTFVLTVFL